MSKGNKNITKKQAIAWDVMIAPVVFACLFIFNCIFTPNFASINTVFNLFTQSASAIILAYGMTLVISGGSIDISVGSTMAMGALGFAQVYNATNNLALGLIVMLAVGLLAGLINGLVIAKFSVQPMVATMATMYIIRSLAKVSSSGTAVPFSHPLLDEIVTLRIWGYIPYQVPLVLVVTLIFYLLANKTSFSVYIEACGDNPLAAKASGLKSVFYIAITHVIVGVLASCCGLMESMAVTSADPIKIGNTYEMDAIAAVIFGGTPSSGGRARIIGTLLGVLTITLIKMMINMNDVQYEYSYVVRGSFVLLAVVAQNLKRSRG